MTTFNELRFWSPLLGCEAARLSIADERGGEFYMIVPIQEGKRWKEARDTALEAIETAIGLGLQPGMVRIQ